MRRNIQIEDLDLDSLNTRVEAEVKKFKDDVESRNADSYNYYIAQKEKEWADTHEAPYEGNMSDLYPLSSYVGKEAYNSGIKTVRAEAVKTWVDFVRFANNESSLLPSISAYIYKNIPITFNSENKVDGRAVLQAFGKDNWTKGLYHLCVSHGTRGVLVSKQTSPSLLSYSALVPLVMMPFKKFGDIPYSKWDKDTINWVVDKHLYDAMSFESDITWTKEEILENRHAGLMYTTNKNPQKIGTLRSPQSASKLYGKLVHPEFKAQPWYIQVMLSQIWLAHPAHRHQFMILDNKNWDAMPEPLIDYEVLPDAPATLGRHVKPSDAAHMYWL